jgi:hypothetical protein
MANSNVDETMEDRRSLTRTLDTVGWGVFFIWIGIALLVNVGWGIGLLGMGIIMLVAQMARLYFSLRMEGFGLVMGILFVVAGILDLLKVNLGQEPIPGGLMPILSIVIGIVLVISAFLRKRH